MGCLLRGAGLRSGKSVRGEGRGVLSGGETICVFLF